MAIASQRFVGGSSQSDLLSVFHAGFCKRASRSEVIDMSLLGGLPSTGLMTDVLPRSQQPTRQEFSYDSLPPTWFEYGGASK